jgi:hypothetical protein
MTTNLFNISREYFNWCFDNPEKVRAAHTAIYFFALDLNNRLGWKEKFGLPTTNAMEATGIKSKNTFYNAFNELIEWGFIEIIKKSKNQNTANIVRIPAALKFKSATNTADKSALDSANIQREDSTVPLDKQVNQKPLNQKQERVFAPPSLNDVKEFFNENGLDVNAAEKKGKRFWRNYDARGWKIGGARIESWKPLAQNWIDEDRDREKQINNPQKPNYNVKTNQQEGRRVGRLTEEEGNKLSNPEGWSVVR